MRKKSSVCDDMEALDVEGKEEKELLGLAREPMG